MRIPQSYNDLTVGQFQECYFLLGHNPQLEDWMRVIAILGKTTYEKLEELPRGKLKKLIYQLQFLLKPNLNTKFNKYVGVNGRVYRAIPFANQLNTAQACDLKTFRGEGDIDTVVENAHKLLASIYLPLTWRGFKYDGKNHEKIANDFLNVKMGKVFGTLFFYSKVSTKLIETTSNFMSENNKILEDHLKELEQWANENPSLITGDGK
jgi:hypothetical protein